MSVLNDYQKRVEAITNEYSKDPLSQGHVYELDVSDMDWFCACGAARHSGEKRKAACPQGSTDGSTVHQNPDPRDPNARLDYAPSHDCLWPVRYPRGLCRGRRSRGLHPGVQKGLESGEVQEARTARTKAAVGMRSMPSGTRKDYYAIPQGHGNPRKAKAPREGQEMMKQPKVRLRKDYTNADWRQVWDSTALKVAEKVLPPLQALWYIIDLMYTMGCQRTYFGNGRVICLDMPGAERLCATCLLRDRLDHTSKPMQKLREMWWGAFGR